ncbi:heavy metal-binding domain-containing protein [Amnibacterium sp. CER49]|uniref:heavy metal-binding domain-containing protein n=1 Tax=Amnibacterium sp. CER49 TaxID=3039161 RepID=UPI002449D803|nr:heavy metal-binding domain-containing protein [Amnibacterium sp. CER49]MDH2445207.1 heavy metal-binding domain-containing protein [Amnibacterium sp. CER49]
MAAWIGGLPPSAHDRVARQRASAVAGSLLSAPAAAALRSAGLAPVGEVFGCLVMQLGWASSPCGWWQPGWSAATWSPDSPVWTTGSRRGGYAAFEPYVQAFEHAWHGALARLLAEAAALGAEGVVGIRIGRTRLDGQAWEFSALGTGVRRVDPTPERAAPESVWHTDLSAEDCAAALRSGLLPRGLALGLSIATKHEDYRLRQQRSVLQGNTEVDGLSELVAAAREDARRQLERRAAALAPKGGTLVVSGMSLGEFETACGQEVDLHAESIVVGTVLAPDPAARSRTRSGAAVLPVIPLSSATDRRSSRRF